MRLTVNELRRIINEEVTRTLGEAEGPTDEMGVVHELIQAIKKLLSRSELASTDPTRFLMLVDSTLVPFLRRKRPESRPMWWGKFSQELNILVDTIRSEDTEDIVEYLKLALPELEELLKEKDMFESRRRNGTINEITLPEMYDELIGGIEDALSNPDSQAKVLAGLRKLMGVKVSDAQLKREEEDRKKMKASGKKYNI